MSNCQCMCPAWRFSSWLTYPQSKRDVKGIVFMSANDSEMSIVAQCVIVDSGPSKRTFGKSTCTKRVDDWYWLTLTYLSLTCNCSSSPFINSISRELRFSQHHGIRCPYTHVHSRKHREGILNSNLLKLCRITFVFSNNLCLGVGLR